MIRNRAVLVALGVAAVALSGCSAAGEGNGGDGGTVEVRMLVNVTPNLTEEFWNDLVAPFEDANPGIDVIIQNPGAESVSATLPRLLAAGDAPDVVQSIPPTPDLAPELVDLSEYDWASGGPLAELYTLDGRYYMAGIGVQLQSLMFYNKTAFEEAGITEPPATIEELSDALAALDAAGWTPIQTGGDWMSSHSLQGPTIPTVVGEDPDWFANISSGAVTFSDTFGPFVERYAEWVAAGYIPAEALGIQYSDAEQAFLAGESAIYPMGSWFAGTEAAADDPAEIGVFRSPALEGVSDPAMGANIASPYSILKSSEHVDEAALLLEFLTTDETAVVNQLVVDGNFRNGYAYETTALGDELFQIVAETPEASYTPTGQGYGESRLPDGYAEELNSQTQALVGGTAAADVNSAMDDWFAANAG